MFVLLVCTPKHFWSFQDWVRRHHFRGRRGDQNLTLSHLTISHILFQFFWRIELQTTPPNRQRNFQIFFSPAQGEGKDDAQSELSFSDFMEESRLHQFRAEEAARAAMTLRIVKEMCHCVDENKCSTSDSYGVHKALIFLSYVPSKQPL